MPKCLKQSIKLHVNGDLHFPERCELNPPKYFFWGGRGRGEGRVRILFSGTQSPLFLKLFSMLNPSITSI